jgi:hypothetical protein
MPKLDRKVHSVDLIGIFWNISYLIVPKRIFIDNRNPIGYSVAVNFRDIRGDYVKLPVSLQPLF